MMKKRIKTIAACLAFLPMVGLFLGNLLFRHGIWPETWTDPVTTVCIIFCYPAYSMIVAVDAHQASKWGFFLFTFLVTGLWSAFMARIFWKLAGVMQGEETAEKPRDKYDWDGFQTRFFFGFVIGFLTGWRGVRYTTSMKTMFTACLIVGMIGGFVYGAIPPPDFWRRD